jgi:ribosome-binding factor A
MKHKDREDPKLAPLREEVDSFFRNELCDEVLMGVKMTRIELTPDRKIMTVYYLAPEGNEELVAPKIQDLGPIIADLVFPILEKRTRVRFKRDRGAENQRRVEELLREIQEKESKD